MNDDRRQETGAPPSAGPRLFLDSADTGDWETWLPRGVFHGVTTNPLLLERAGQACTVASLAELARRALGLGAAEIHLQAWGAATAELEQRGRKLGGIDPRVVVKIPLTETGLPAARALVGAGHRVTLTALFDAGQALLAAAAGAAYAAPYLGRIDDAGGDGMGEVVTMHEILARTGSATRLLVASLRTAEQVVALARLGLDTFTIGAELASDLLASATTSAAVADFARAADGARPPRSRTDTG
jgi:transaldolase